MTLSYLVSTAGHAQNQNRLHPHDIRTILQLIEDGATELKGEKVVGFPSDSGADGRWVCECLSFTELLASSDRLAAANFARTLGNGRRDDGTCIVSLLCPTGLDFLLAWIALMRMGLGVVFVAPQCSPSGVNHLLGSSSSTHLIYHPMYANLAHAVEELEPTTTILQLLARSAYQTDTTIPATSNCTLVATPEMVSHMFHTSGTSGAPKLIPQTHIASVSVLPRRARPSYLSTAAFIGAESTMPPFESAAFTTTPLFHGGVSDLLRAWMARSMIYFYPTSDAPITSLNVNRAIEACNAPPPRLPFLDLNQHQLEERRKRFVVGSFLSVPYILTVLSEDLDGPGMKMLRSMELVSTGGAPLDTRIGDRMVERGVRLVSRLGSSECGFLLSSHRDYGTENDWEWLRNDSAYSDALLFEPVDGDGTSNEEKFEMLVTENWKSKTKTNRKNGNYATGDLYLRHPTKKNVWRFAGKGDDVLVLSNGEKASPGPIESALRACPLLSDVLVVGADRPQLGLLLFPRFDHSSLSILEAVSPLLLQANRMSPSYGQISKEMCLVVNDPVKIELLPKSSKGTIQRGLAYEAFRNEIQRLYDDIGWNGRYAVETRSLSEIENCVKGLIMDAAMGTTRKVEASSLHGTTDLFAWGVDSLMASRIRSGIQRILNTGEQILPNNIVFEKPSIARLSQYIFNLQEGKDTKDSDDRDPHRLMEELVKTYRTFGQASRTHRSRKASIAKRGKTFVLTGATGSLGSFLLEKFSRLPSEVVNKIVCLVRAEDDKAAWKRIQDGLTRRGFEKDIYWHSLEAYAADLTKRELGLTSQVYAKLVDEVDTVIHAAWPVHFGSSLISFADNIEGTRNLLNFLDSGKADRPRFYYCSSLASVVARCLPDGSILELPSDDPSTASAIGYSQSKWVTEKICRQASEQGEDLGLDGLRVHVLRVGQLCGDTDRGHWNEKEGWPLLVRTAQTTGCLPILQEEISWLPVDLAARAITEIVTGDQADAQFVYHVVHPITIKWSIVLKGLEAAGLTFERVPQQVWLDKVKTSSDDLSKGMLSIWQAAYGNRAGDEVQREPRVDSTNAQAASVTLRNIEPIDLLQIEKMVHAWRRTGFLH